MQLARSHSPIELKAPDPESPLRKLIRLYFAFAWAVSRRSGYVQPQPNRGQGNRMNRARIAAYLVRA